MTIQATLFIIVPFAMFVGWVLVLVLIIDIA
jgi:hypothetical protein